MSKLIYKVSPRSAWEAAQSQGVFNGAPIDLADGFIHFSTAEQVEETVAKHFRGQQDLLLIAFEAEPFGDALKWEVSRGGDRFPHLYATLDPASAVAQYPLDDNDDGTHTFPDTY